MRTWLQFVSLALLLAVVSLLALVVVHERVYGPHLDDAVDATTSSQLSHEAMLDQQAGLRAYAITGDERFLEAYERGAESLPVQTDQLTAQVAGDARATQLVFEVRLAQQAWIERWGEEALAAGRAGGVGTEADELLLEGKELFDGYRASQVALMEELTADRSAAIGGQSSAIVRTAGLALAIVLLLGLPAAVWIRRLQRSVDPALAALDEHLERIRHGDLEPRPGFKGPSELARINAGLDETAASLAAARGVAEAHAARIERQNQNLGHVLELSREVAGSLSLRYIVRGLCTAASSIVDGRRVVVWLRCDDGPARLCPRADSEGPGLDPSGLDPILLGEGPVGRAARFGRIQGREDELLVGVGATSGPRVTAVPMVVGANVVGVIEILGVDAAELPGDERNVLEALAIQAASAVGAAEVHEMTAQLAVTDSLTRLPNRRRLEEDLATEVAVAVRHGRPLGFAMIDVDQFKSYNDTFGHQAGDVALQEIAGVVTRTLRAGDSGYRYGGEELAVIMRESDGPGAAGHAERLRQAVAHHFEGPGQPRNVTISIGVASIPDHASEAEGLVAAADRALYRAKAAGRDRVELARVENGSLRAEHGNGASVGAHDLPEDGHLSRQ